MDELGICKNNEEYNDEEKTKEDLTAEGMMEQKGFAGKIKVKPEGKKYFFAEETSSGDAHKTSQVMHEVFIAQDPSGNFARGVSELSAMLRLMEGKRMDLNTNLQKVFKEAHELDDRKGEIVAQYEKKMQEAEAMEMAEARGEQIKKEVVRKEAERGMIASILKRLGKKS